MKEGCVRIQVHVSGRDEESTDRRSDIDGKLRDARHGRSSAVISVVSSTSREADVRRLDVRNTLGCSTNYL